MKKLFLPLILSCSTFGFAQSKTNTTEDVAKMPVYPGCDAHQTNEELSTCFKKSLYLDIAKELEDFADKVNSDIQSNFVSVSHLVVRSNGMIENVEIKGDHQLSAAVESAIHRLNTKLKENHLRIAPAKDHQGKAMDLAYQLPVRFSIQ